MRAFISGHLDLSEEEFRRYYIPYIDFAIARGYEFVVGDAPGADTMAQSYLSKSEFCPVVTVYHMFAAPRNCLLEHAHLVGGFASDRDRDAAMTRASDYDIAWVRPGREKSGTAKNLKRRMGRMGFLDKHEEALIYWEKNQRAMNHVFWLDDLLEIGWEVLTGKEVWLPLTKVLGKEHYAGFQVGFDDRMRAEQMVAPEDCAGAHSLNELIMGRSPIPDVRFRTLLAAASRMGGWKNFISNLVKIIREVKEMDAEQLQLWLAQEMFLNDNCWG